jgi:hypothetical protein
MNHSNRKLIHPENAREAALLVRFGDETIR